MADETSTEQAGREAPFFGVVEEIRGVKEVTGASRVVARCWTPGEDDAEGFHEDFHLTIRQWTPPSNTLVRDAGTDDAGAELIEFYDNQSLYKPRWRRYRHLGEAWWEEVAG